MNSLSEDLERFRRGAELLATVLTGAAMLASQRICLALGIKPEEEKYRFGFAA